MALAERQGIQLAGLMAGEIPAVPQILQVTPVLQSAQVGEVILRLSASDLQNPGQKPRPGSEAEVRLQFLDPQTGKPLKDFVPAHEKLLHLILVSEDLESFDHRHPELEADGTFRDVVVFPKKGRFMAFAEVTPRGRPAQTLEGLVEVGEGPFPLPEPLRRTERTKTFGDLRVSLQVHPEAPSAGEPMHLTFRIADARTGRPIRDLEPFLGASGHAILIGEGAKAFVHAHAMEDHGGGDGGHGGHGGHNGPSAQIGPEIMFMTEFPRPGPFKIWGQFGRGGKVLTFDFVIQTQQR